MAPKVSVIIPVKKINDFIRLETIPALLKQSVGDFEVIILPDRPSREKFKKTKVIASWPKTGPADKRDMGAKKARGEILAFLDDDSYPDKNWLKNALRIFSGEKNETAAVCGPQLTPPHNNRRQKASGYVWSSWLGSGGAGTYRCTRGLKREVDDYPTVNLLVKKKDFARIGGFDSRFWPGEDTKLCHDLVYKLKKKIIYDPAVVVYHHRREVLVDHLRQIGRYALHRGHFARILPKTSLKIGYFVPTFFSLGLVFGLPLIFIFYYFNFADLSFFFWSVWLFSIIFYCFLLFLTSLRVYLKENDFLLSALVMGSIVLTHLVYGFLFIKGLLTPNLVSRYRA